MPIVVVMEELIFEFVDLELRIIDENG